MPKEKLISIAQLNIVALEHPEGTYIDLFKAAFQLKRPVKYRGSDFLMLGELYALDRSDSQKGFTGKFYKFTHIDSNSDWFDFDKHDAASSEEVAEKVNIPENLKPNCVRYDFTFIASSHTLFYISKDGNKTIGTVTVSKFLDTLFNAPEILKVFGDIKITAIPEQETLEKIFSIHRLSTLEIDLHCPNPDDPGSEEDRVEKRLKKQKAKSFRQVLTALPNETIEPDDETKLYARVAAQNGKVVGSGKTYNNVTVKLSTVDHPKIQTVRFDTTVESEADVLLRTSTA